MCLYVGLNEQAIAEGETSVKGKDRTPGQEARLFVISRRVFERMLLALAPLLMLTG